ncbi:MAG: hypothetical protein EXR51_11450 [Dehalococcoidia bacterium]|nr:hypothetical protein [Dehalococcoidia bacterium]
MTKRRQWGLIAAFTGLAVAMRWPGAQRQFEYDKAISILFAQLDFQRMIQATAADTMPPLYYALLHFWNTALVDLTSGSGVVFWSRMFSVIIAAVTVPVFFQSAHFIADERDAVIATGLVAVAPFHVFYGHYVRMYGLMLLTGIATATFFLLWLRDGRRWQLGAFAVAAAVSLYVHSLAFLLILTLDAIVLVQAFRRTERSRFGGLALAHAGIVVAYFPWLVHLPGQVEKVARAFWITPPGPAEIIRTVLVFHFHLPLPAWALFSGAFIGLVLAAVTVLETRRRWLYHPDERHRLATLTMLAVLPAMLMFPVSQVRPIYIERAVLFSASVYFVLLAGALRLLPSRRFALVLGSVLAGGLVVGNVHQYYYEEFPRSPFDAATAFLSQHSLPGDIVLHDNKLSYSPSLVLSRELPQAYLPDPPNSPNDTMAAGTTSAMALEPTSLENAVSGRRRVWLVVFRQELAESDASGRALASKHWLDSRYSSPQETRIGDLSIYLYSLEG